MESNFDNTASAKVSTILEQGSYCRPNGRGILSHGSNIAVRVEIDETNLAVSACIAKGLASRRSD
jgi:hypothetical protein